MRRGRHLPWLLLPALAGCAVGPGAPLTCHAPGQPMLDAELLFGLPLKGNTTPDPAAFDAFVAQQITPRFPDGLTIYDARGQYRPPGGHIERETSRMVEVVVAGTPAAQTRLDDIRRAYRLQFNQRSVGLILIASCASF